MLSPRCMRSAKRQMVLMVPVTLLVPGERAHGLGNWFQVAQSAGTTGEPVGLAVAALP